MFEKVSLGIAAVVCFCLAIGSCYFFCGGWSCENKGFGTLFGRLGLFGFSIYGIVFAYGLWRSLHKK